MLHVDDSLASLSLLPRIQQLELMHVSRIAFPSAVSSMTSLTSLTLSCCMEFDRQGAHFAKLGLGSLSALGNLQALNIFEHGINLSPACSFAFLSSLTSLTRLSLALWFPFALDLGFWNQHCQMPDIQVVSLEGPAIADEAVRAVIHACPRLSEVLVSSICFSGVALSALQIPSHPASGSHLRSILTGLLHQYVMCSPCVRCFLDFEDDESCQVGHQICWELF